VGPDRVAYSISMTADDPVTKAGLDDALENFAVRMEKMVGSVVGEIVGDALQVVSERFDRIEDKLDENIARVDHHDVDIRELNRKIA